MKDHEPILFGVATGVIIGAVIFIGSELWKAIKSKSDGDSRGLGR